MLETKKPHWEAFSSLCTTVKGNAVPLNAEMSFGQFMGFKLMGMTDARKNHIMGEMMKLILSSNVQPLQASSQPTAVINCSTNKPASTFALNSSFGLLQPQSGSQQSRVSHIVLNKPASATKGTNLIVIFYDFIQHIF